jgi:hypothetical protein
MDDVEEIVVVSTNISQPCKFGCTLLYGGDDFQSNVNHYLKEHDYKLLHVGQESEVDSEGMSYHTTVAVLAAPKLGGK